MWLAAPAFVGDFSFFGAGPLAWREPCTWKSERAGNNSSQLPSSWRRLFSGKGDEGGATEDCRAPRSGGRRTSEAAANFFPTLPPGVIGCCSVTTGRPCSSQVVGPQLPTAKVQSWLWPVGDPSMQLGTGGPARAEGSWLCCPKRVRGPVEQPWGALPGCGRKA